MCGLYGWGFNTYRGIGMARREVMAGSLALSNARRGDDSYGALIRRAGRNMIIKHIGSIAQAKGVSAWGREQIVMAHTRQATHGAVTTANQHPFTVKHVTLAHNGVIANHSELNQKHKRSCIVDSEHLAIHMAEGADFKDIEGYGSITWTDAGEPDTVKLCRMRNGSLAICGVKLGGGERAPQVGVVWSSDERHLEAALKAAGLDFFHYEEPREGVVYEVKGGKLWVTDAKVTISSPSFVDRRTVLLSQGIKTDREWSWSAAVVRSMEADPTIESRIAEVVNDERPASWAQRRAELAKDLGLIQTSATKWVDDQNNMIDAEELDELMEDREVVNH